MDSTRGVLAEPRRSHGAGENRLLAALPRDAYERLLPKLETVRLEARQVLSWPNEPIAHVYFLVSGVVSMLAVLQGGPTIDVGLIGNEGMVGLPGFWATGSLPLRVIVQVGGEARRLRAGALRAAVEAEGAAGPLSALLLRYTHALVVQSAQTAACNRIHRVEERCARWLLQTQDRLGAARWPLTHEFLAQMLGVRRASVSVVMRTLQHAGILRYHRGEVAILSRAALEAAACPCYRIITAEFDRLLGGFGGTPAEQS